MIEIILSIIILYESAAGQKTLPTFSTYLYQLPVYSGLLFI